MWYRCEGKSSCVCIHLSLRRYFELVILNKILALEHTDHKCLDNVKRGLSVVMWALVFAIYQVIASKEKL